MDRDRKRYCFFKNCFSPVIVRYKVEHPFRLSDAIAFLQPVEGDVIQFDTGRVWDQGSFFRSIPEVDFSKIVITEDDVEQLTELAHSLSKNFDSGGHEMFMSMPITKLDTDKLLQLLSLVNNVKPLQGYYVCKSVETVILTRKNEDGGISSMALMKDGDGKFLFLFVARFFPTFNITTRYMELHKLASTFRF